MSAERRERLASLLRELERLEQRLEERETPTDALAFLDLLVRCEAFPPGEIEAQGGSSLLRAASLRRAEFASTLGELAARAVDPERLREQALSFITMAERGDLPETAEWASELLRLANAAPYLEDLRRRRAAAVIEELLDWIEANPDAFVETAKLAEDRRRAERPERIRDTLGADLLNTFLEARELAAYDREQEGSAEVRGLPQRFASSQASVREFLEQRVSREFAVQEAPLDLAARAKDYGVGEHALLRRLEEGEFVLTQVDEALFVDWYGRGQPELSLVENGSREALPHIEIQDGLRWALPEGSGSRRLEAKLGERTIELVIPA